MTRSFLLVGGRRSFDGRHRAGILIEYSWKGRSRAGASIEYCLQSIGTIKNNKIDVRIWIESHGRTQFVMKYSLVV